MGTKDFADDFKGLKITEDQDINILLLGETGVGKSTFINSIANYLHFKHFKKASKGELLILIPSVVTITNEDFEQVTIRVGSDNNEYQEVGVAGTQDVKTYVFPIGEGKTRLRLIDSPGMGDPRGIEQDDINCENILAYLSQLKELHAICFLMKPTTTRITVFFQYCVDQILSRLDKTASRNIIFIFTNTRGTNYTPGDTLPCLRKLVEDIKAKPPHVDIPLKNNIFSLDNEAFKFLVGVKNDVKFDQYVQERFIDSWNNSSKECWRLISYIVGDASHDAIKPHQMQNTISINEARRLVIHLSQPLADISQLIYDNIRILDRHQRNLNMENQTLDELKKKMYIPIINLQVTQLTQPVTVCTSPKCADVVKVGEVSKWHYRQRCHDPCYLTNVSKEFIGDPNLQHCAAMSGRTCMKCTCDFAVHMHVYYMTKTVEDKIVDDIVKNNINQKEAAVREAQRLIGEIDRRKRELEEEREAIIKSTAQFAHFLQHNAISPFNDSYKAYIEYLIKRERSLGRHGDQGTINNLEQLLRQYEEIKAAFDNSLQLNNQHGLNAFVSSVTAQSVIDTIHKLYQLKHNGSKIKELIKKQKTSRNSEYDQNCEYVHPKTAGVYTSESKAKSKKDKKNKGGKTSDEDKKEKSKKDKKKSDGATDDEQKFKKGPYVNKGPFPQRGNRHYGHTQNVQTPPNRSNFSQREPPPPYSSYENSSRNPRFDNSSRNPQRSQSTSGQSKSDSEPNLVVKVELTQPPKPQNNSNYQPHGNDPYYRAPPSGGYGPPPPPSPSSYYGSHYGPQDQYRGPPPEHYRGPPAEHYRGPPAEHYRGPPEQYRGPPNDPYYGPNHYGPNQYGPPQGQYGQHYGPPPNQPYGPQSDYHQGQPLGQYQGAYQKQYRPNESGRGRPFHKRGTGNKRGRSKPRREKGSKSGNEKSGTEKSSYSSGSDSD